MTTKAANKATANKAKNNKATAQAKHTPAKNGKKGKGVAPATEAKKEVVIEDLKPVAKNRAALETLGTVMRDGQEGTVSVRRQLLTTKSKCMVIKELLCNAEPLHVKDIFAQVAHLHNGTDKALKSTINTLKADMIRAGMPVTAYADRARTGSILPPTAEVLKLRGPEVGGSKHTLLVQEYVAPVKAKTEEKTEEKGEQLPAPPAELTIETTIDKLPVAGMQFAQSEEELAQELAEEAKELELA